MNTKFEAYKHLINRNSSALIVLFLFVCFVIDYVILYLYWILSDIDISTPRNKMT